MRFGRVEGIMEWIGAEEIRQLRLTVFLETSSEYKIVREEFVSPVGSSAEKPDLFWLADQYTQETLGVDLAEEGWEVIGSGDPPNSEVEQIARSASYTVRKI